MRSLHKQDICRRCVFALTALIALAVPALTQERNLRSVLRVRVKPDRVGDFQAGVKEYSAILKKANSERWSTWWVSLTGPREYALVQYHAKWAELDVTQDPKLKDVAADVARIMARLLQCSEGSDRIIEQVQHDLGLPMSQETPKMVRVIRTRVRPEKVNDYMALVKSDLLPAITKSGAKLFVVARTRYGGPSSEFSSAVGINSWADLDGPPPVVRAMGEEGYRQFLAKLMPLVTETEYRMYQFLPDLSYIPGN